MATSNPCKRLCGHDIISYIGQTKPDIIGMGGFYDWLNVATMISWEIKKHFPKYDVNSYLGGTSDHKSIKWLLGNIILNTRGKMFGSFGYKTMELAQSFYHLKTGKYLVHMKKTGFGKKLFLLSVFDKQLRNSFGNFIRYVLANPLRFFAPVKTLNIGIVQPPDFLIDGATDMCAGCPDMCVFEGKLVNSCRLDECLKFGSFVQFHAKEKDLVN